MATSSLESIHPGALCLYYATKAESSRPLTEPNDFVHGTFVASSDRNLPSILQVNGCSRAAAAAVSPLTDISNTSTVRLALPPPNSIAGNDCNPIVIEQMETYLGQWTQKRVLDHLANEADTWNKWPSRHKQMHHGKTLFVINHVLECDRIGCDSKIAHRLGMSLSDGLDVVIRRTESQRTFRKRLKMVTDEFNRINVTMSEQDRLLSQKQLTCLVNVLCQGTSCCDSIHLESFCCRAEDALIDLATPQVHVQTNLVAIDSLLSRIQDVITFATPTTRRRAQQRCCYTPETCMRLQSNVLL